MSVARRRLRIHLGLVLAETICIGAFIIEVLRAEGGNTLSWVYVILWPVFAVYAVYVWRTLLHQEAGGSPPRLRSSATDDLRLAEWNEYLRRVHEEDPPTET